MKVGIIIIVYNLDSRVFLLQIESLRKFCKDDYEIQIIDNSTDSEKSEAVRYHSSILELGYCKTNSVHQNGSQSHAFALNFSYQRFKHYGYNVLFYLDHDVIAQRDFSIIKILGEDKIFAGMGQGKNGITYYWAGCVSWRTDKVDLDLIDFNTDEVLGLDTGGKLYKAIEKYGIENCIFFDETYFENPQTNSTLYHYYSMINKGMFLHFINASNWNFITDNEERISSLINIASIKINEKETKSAD